MASRLISDSVSRSDGLAALSPKALALFFLLLPNLNAHGKMSAEVATIKGLVAPKIKWLTPAVIRRCLEEISQFTNIRWFEAGGLHYLHALNFAQHQPGLRRDRMGNDALPSYSGTTPGGLPEYSVPEVEVKEKRREFEVNGSKPFSLPSLSKPLPSQEQTAQEAEDRRRLLQQQGRELVAKDTRAKAETQALTDGGGI